MEITVKQPHIVMSDDNKNIQSDYDYSRQTYYELIEKGRESLEDMIEVARASEHPRAYEVLSGMIKNLSDVNDKLMDLNKKVKDLEDDPKKIENQQNNIFLGSTADIQKLLRQGEIIDSDPEPNAKLLRES